MVYDEVGGLVGDLEMVKKKNYMKSLIYEVSMKFLELLIDSLCNGYLK